MEINESQLTQSKIELMTLKESYDKLLENEKNFKELNEKYRQSFLAGGGQQDLEGQVAAGSTTSESQAQKAQSQQSMYKDQK